MCNEMFRGSGNDALVRATPKLGRQSSAKVPTHQKQFFPITRARACANASQLTRDDHSLRFASTTARARADQRSSNGVTYEDRFEDVCTFVVLTENDRLWGLVFAALHDARLRAPATAARTRGVTNNMDNVLVSRQSPCDVFRRRQRSWR